MVKNKMVDAKNKETKKRKTGLMDKAIELSKENKANKGLLKHITEKNGAKGMMKVIVEKNGIFTIQSGIETSDIKQNPKLKALVDSILK